MNRRYWSFLLVFCLLFGLAATPAHAYVSEQDRKSGNADVIQKYTDAYNAAAARGDKAGMNAAHAAVEKLRNESGYSGGADGTGSSSSSKGSSGNKGSSSNKGGGSSGSGNKNSGSSSSPTSTEEKVQQMATNSAAWIVAKEEYKAAVASGDKAAAAAAQKTMNNLSSAQNALAKEIAGKGGSVSRDAASGTTIITTADGKTISNAGVSKNGGIITTKYLIEDSKGNKTENTATSFSEGALAAYTSAGGTKEGAKSAYNQTGKEIAQSMQYGDKYAITSTEDEIAMVKLWYPNLSDKELSDLEKSLKDAKEEYGRVYDKYLKAETDAKRQELREKMQALNEEAEAARAEIGYSGNLFVDDGGFFVPTQFVSGGSGGGSSAPAADTLARYYAIVAKAVGGGTISPSGTVNVPEGGSKHYAMTPSSGYILKSVVVDGTDTGTPATYDFTNVQAPHTITATFVKKGSVTTGDLELKNSLGVSLYDNAIKSGYGVFATLKNVQTENVEDLKVVLTYNFGGGEKSVTMISGTGGYVLPVNSASPTGANCIYIPVETKDGTYTLTATATGTDVNTGLAVKSTATGTITVKGSMYEDDFTGNSGRR